MDEDMQALTSYGTWELVTNPTGTNTVSYKWVFIVKHKLDGLDRYKARLVARGSTQTYGVDYEESFSPVAPLNSIRVLLFIAVNQS